MRKFKMMKLYFICFMMMVTKKIWMVMNVLLLWNSIVKNFSTLYSNSSFARHLESKVVTFKRLMNFKRPILVEFLQYLDLDDVDGATRKVLSNLILKAYKNFISVNSSK